MLPADRVEVPVTARIGAWATFAGVGAVAVALFGAVMAARAGKLGEPKSWFGIFAFGAMGAAAGGVLSQLRRRRGRLTLDRAARTLTLALGPDTWTIELSRPFDLRVFQVMPRGIYAFFRTAVILTQGEARIGFWCVPPRRGPFDGEHAPVPPIDLGTDQRGWVIYQHLREHPPAA